MDSGLHGVKEGIVLQCFANDSFKIFEIVTILSFNKHKVNKTKQTNINRISNLFSLDKLIIQLGFATSDNNTYRLNKFRYPTSPCPIIIYPNTVGDYLQLHLFAIATGSNNVVAIATSVSQLQPKYRNCNHFSRIFNWVSNDSLIIHRIWSESHYIWVIFGEVKPGPPYKLHTIFIVCYVV